MKKNELLIQATTCMTLKGIMLLKGASIKELHTVLFYLYNILRKTKLLMENRSICPAACLPPDYDLEANVCL